MKATKALKIVREIDSVVFPERYMLFSRCFLIWMESLHWFLSKEPRSPEPELMEHILAVSLVSCTVPEWEIRHLPHCRGLGTHESSLYSFRSIPTETCWRFSGKPLRSQLGPELYRLLFQKSREL